MFPAPKPPVKKTPDRGFTLIETLIALALVSFLVAGTAELIGLALLTKRKAEAHIEATRIFQNRLERLRALPFDHPDLEPGEHREPIEPENGAGNFTCEWMIEELPRELKRIAITVSGPAGTSAEAALLISAKLGFGP
jgi:prepilin-type N-terminal cleavage/methylation domain-containing protein